jgi:RNA polymerase sigma-70 factor (ECF subfamily)
MSPSAALVQLSRPVIPGRLSGTMTSPPEDRRAPHEDTVLAQRCVAGDRAAQDEVFTTYRTRVHATLYRLVRSNGPMDDLVQEAFLNVYRSLRIYRGESSLATWIDRCTVRVAFAWIAQRKAHPPPLELVQDVPAGDPSAERRTLAREAARHFFRALAKLDPKLRVAFTLHALDGRPLAEVAHLMDSTLVATKTRVWRARRALSDLALKDPVLASLVQDGGRDGEEVA